jgi:hypothetical protein
MASEANVQRFLEYPFDEDAEYQAGLQTILQTAVSQGIDQAELELQAKVFFFCRATGDSSLTIELVKQYRESHPESASHDCYSSTTGGSSAMSDDPPYSVSYKEIVELILSGKPIPGIRQIPDTVLGEDAASKGGRAPRKKPWEQ